MPRHEQIIYDYLHKGIFDSGLDANRPTVPEGVGDAYYASDTEILYVANSSGDAWVGYLLTGTTAPDAILVRPTVLSASASSISFTSIPGTYYELIAVLTLRSDNASLTDSLTLTVNSDSGSNYRQHLVELTGTTRNIVTDSSSNTSFTFADAVPASTATSNRFCKIEFRISGYQIAEWKQIHHRFQHTPNDTGANFEGGWGINKWASTSAITSLEFLPLNGSNFVSGSTYALYGLGASP